MVKPEEAFKEEEKEEEKQQLSHLRGFDKELAQTYELSQRFVKMVKNKADSQLKERLNQVKGCCSPELLERGLSRKVSMSLFSLDKNNLKNLIASLHHYCGSESHNQTDCYCATSIDRAGCYKQTSSI